MKEGWIFKPLDLGAIGLALSITVFSAICIYAGTGSPKRVIIQGTGVKWVFPQDQQERISVPGPLGDTVVELRDSSVRVLSSPCGNQTCVSAGAIQSHGQWIACLPNQVLVLVEGRGISEGTGDELDGAVW